MRTVVSMLLLFCCVTMYATEPNAKLTFIGKRIINAGDVKKGDIVKRNISFKNEGNAPLLINEVQKSCTCTNASISKKELQPGETSIITIEVDTSQKIGEYRANVIISTNAKPKDYIAIVIMNVI